MGDLSHELETLVIQIDGGAVAADDHAHAVMQASLDELARMRDLVSTGSAARCRAGAARADPRPCSGGVARCRARGAAALPPPRRRGRAAGPAPTPARRRAACRRRARASSATPPRATRDAPRPVAPGAPAIAEESLPSISVSDDSLSQLEVSSGPVLPGRESAPAERVEMARVDADLLDTMLNNAGEVSIFRSRLDQQVNSIDFNLAELARTVTRLKEQLRGLEIETEAQVLNRHQDEEDPRRDDFDPLELDRYSALQQFSRALAETSGDVASIQGLARDADARGAESADAAGPHHHRAAEQPDAHAHGAVPAARAAAHATGAPGGERHRQARGARGAGRFRGARPADARAHGGAARAHAAQRRRARHRGAGAARGARQAGRRAHLGQPDARRRGGRDRGRPTTAAASTSS